MTVRDADGRPIREPVAHGLNGTVKAYPVMSEYRKQREDDARKTSSWPPKFDER